MIIMVRITVMTNTTTAAMKATKQTGRPVANTVVELCVVYNYKI